MEIIVYDVEVKAFDLLKIDCNTISPQSIVLNDLSINNLDVASLILTVIQ